MTKVDLRSDLATKLTSTLKGKISEYTQWLQSVRAAELTKSTKIESCLFCSSPKCTCAAMLAKAELDEDGRKLADQTEKFDGDDEGSGSDVKRVKKALKKAAKKAVKNAVKALEKAANPPMAKPPTKAPSAPPPTSKPGSGMAKSETSSKIPRLAKSDLNKAGMRLGGKDPASQAMTQHAATAGAPAPAAAAPKLSPEDQSRRSAEFADFTPAGAFTASGAGSSQGGAPKPGRLDRFKKLKLGKAEMASGKCQKCMKSAHDGAC